MALHTMALTGTVMQQNLDQAREIIENFVIVCEKCNQPIPFEPRSRYRARKLESISKRFTMLANLENDPKEPWKKRPLDPVEKQFLDIACPAAGVIYQAIEGQDCLQNVRMTCNRVIQETEENGRRLGVDLSKSEAMKLLREMADIAKADVGECADLVVSSADLQKVEEKFTAKIRAADQSKEAAQKPKSSSTCFIATAATDPGHPHVECLRRFRDDVLQHHPAGRTFVRWYEHLSPPIADRIRHKPQLRYIFRTLLILPLASIVRWSRH